MAGGLNQILDMLQVAKSSGRGKAIGDAYDAGYKTLAHRVVGSKDDPLYLKINSNIGRHADLSGGAQAKELERMMKSNGFEFPHTYTLLARTRKPTFMLDAEVNDPLVMANALGDRQLNKEVNWAQFRYPDQMVEMPLPMRDDGGSMLDPQLPLFKVLNRRAAERALARKGYDSVIYPNELEGDMSGLQTISDDLLASRRKREDFAQSLLSTYDDPATRKWFNPAMTTIDPAGYRDVMGDLLMKRDFKSPGYCKGGLAQMSSKRLR